MPDALKLQKLDHLLDDLAILDFFMLRGPPIKRRTQNAWFHVDVPTEQDVVENTHPIEQSEVLERSGNAKFCNFVGCCARDIFSGQPDSSLVWRVKPGDRVRKCCLPTSIWTNEAKNFTRANNEIHACDGDNAAEPTLDPAAL